VVGYNIITKVNHLINVTHVISDTNIGGAGRMLLAYLNRRAKDEFNVSVVLPEGSLLIPRLEESGVEFVTVPYMADRSFDIRAVFRLKGIFKSLKPDIVHTHAAFSARLAAKLYGKCKIVHTRHSVFDQSAAKKRFPVKQLLGFMNNKFSDVIVAVSPAAKQNITETGTNPKKVVVVYNGVEPLEPLTERERQEARAELGYLADDFVCVCAARLEREKGVEYILKAAEMLIQSHPQVRFVIAGIGSEEDSLRQAAERAELSNVTFLGFVSDVRGVFGIADIMVNASHGTEATSLSLIEGMSLGLPAVVSDFGGNPFVVGEGMNGLLFPKRDATALYNAIVKIFEDRFLHAEMGERARIKYEERFTAAVMADNLENIYRGLVR
jgi:glycosyltransferase involved in cell wall biosynthesis